MSRIVRRFLLETLKIVMGAVVIVASVGPSPLRAAEKKAGADDAAVVMPDVEKTEIDTVEVKKPRMGKTEATAERELNETEVENDQDTSGKSGQGMGNQDRDMERQAKEADREMKEAERDEHHMQLGADDKGREIEKEVGEVRDNSDRHGGESGGSSGGSGNDGGSGKGGSDGGKGGSGGGKGSGH